MVADGVGPAERPDDEPRNESLHEDGAGGSSSELGNDDRGSEGADDADIDARFEEIVAGLRAEQAQTQQRRQEAIRRAQAQRRAHNRPLEGFDNPNPWPPVPRQRPDPPAEGEPSRDDVGRHRAPQEPPSHSDQQPSEAWRSWEESDEEEHFVQPNPPLPAGDLHLWSIVAGLLGGPLLLILSEVFNVLRGDWWTLAGILLSVAGVVLLFMRLPKTRDYTDSSGGAQV